MDDEKTEIYINELLEKNEKLKRELQSFDKAHDELFIKNCKLREALELVIDPLTQHKYGRDWDINIRSAIRQVLKELDE